MKDRKTSFDYSLLVEDSDTLADTEVGSLSSDNDQELAIVNKGSCATSPMYTLGMLFLLTVQYYSINIYLRHAMKDPREILTSSAFLGSECLKVLFSVVNILFVQRKDMPSIMTYLKVDWRNTLLLVFPACIYNLQMSFEYFAMAHMGVDSFGVMVHAKVIFAAIFALLVFKEKLTVVQGVSLALLTTVIMLCHYTGSFNVMGGIIACLVFSVSTGFASVYTEKAIKAQATVVSKDDSSYGLAYSQIQLSLFAILTIGLYAIVKDHEAILEYGPFHNFSFESSTWLFCSDRTFPWLALLLI